MTEQYRKMYFHFTSEKWVTVTNGFDSEEFDQLGKIERSRKFTITYVGNIAYSRSPEVLLHALGGLVREGVFHSNNLTVKFIGSCRYTNGVPIQRMIADQGLEGIVEILDIIPRPKALIEMMKSHVLVLLANNQRFQVPGKAYEYIRAGRPILALTEEGATADLVKQTRTEVVVSPANIASIKKSSGLGMKTTSNMAVILTNPL